MVGVANEGTDNNGSCGYGVSSKNDVNDDDINIKGGRGNTLYLGSQMKGVGADKHHH